MPERQTGPTGPEMVVINCSEETKWVWEALSAGYETNAHVLQELVHAHETNPRSARSTSPLHPSQQKSVGKPPERIRVPCTEDLKSRWVSISDGYDNYSDQLRALMSAYANEVRRCRAIRFEL